MNISMLENGMDSLQHGFRSYLQYKERTKDRQPELQDYFILKHAILNTHHGVEILLKYIVQNKSEFLIIKEIDKNYRKAYTEMQENGMASVFNTSIASKIHTITYEEALERVKDLCGVQIETTVENKLKDLNVYRNALTHAEINVNDEIVEKLFDGLLVDLDVLFLKAIGEEYEAFYGFSEVKANYDHYMKYYDEKNLPLKKSAFEAYIKAIEKNDMQTSDKITYTEDIDKAKKFFKIMQDDNLEFGMDLYNGYCSGKVRIKVLDDIHISIWAYDNNDEYIFKFKSLMLFFPEYKSNESPIFVLESADDVVDDENEKYVYDDILEGRYIQDKAEFNPKLLQEFYDRCDNDETFVIPANHGIVRFLKGRIIGCFNIQGLKYWNFHKLLRIAENKSGLEFKKLLEKLVERAP